MISGSYQVKFVKPSGIKFTTATAGSDRGMDSNPSGDGATASITLREGESNQTIDAGVILDLASGIPVEKLLEQFEQLDDNLDPEGIPDLNDDEVVSEETNKNTNMNSNDKVKGTLPQTGESAPVLPWIGVLLMAGAVALWSRKRVKRDADHGN